MAMGGFEMQFTDGNHRLNFSEIKDLITRKVILASSIAITEEEISGQSKTDQLSKLITCVQILWFALPSQQFQSDEPFYPCLRLPCFCEGR